MSATILMKWDGESMWPANRYAKGAANAEFVVGLAYRMQALEERSAKAHAAYFATVTEAWRNLSDDDQQRFPSSDHLRKFALIKTGFANSIEIVCATNKDAITLAALAQSLDAYCLAEVSDRGVRVWTARSQSYPAMPKGEFMKSQEAVREFCAGLIGVSPATLDREAGRNTA